MKQFLCYILFFALVAACSPYSKKLEFALQHAGDNRAELEKVLQNYSRNPDDKLKYKAACFLIENMPWHYSYSGDGIRKYYSEIDNLLSSGMSNIDIFKETERISKKYPNLKSKLVEDIHIITADYLIRNIDAAFKNWKENPWTEHLTFDQFCEYLLPYKGNELQELDNWRDTLAAKFGCILENRLPNDERNNSVYFAASALNDGVIEKLNMFDPGVEICHQVYHFLSASTMSRIKWGECVIVSNMLNCVMRANGIPSMIEYVPMWGRSNGSHQFYTILDEKGNYLPVMWGFSYVGTSPISQTYAPKILRKSYKHNERILEYYRNTKYKKVKFNFFDLDVTDLYLTTENISIPVSTKRLKGKYAYISVFNNMRWDVIDFGDLKSGKAFFSKVARNYIYLIWGYDGSNLVPISDPFMIRSNGTIEYLIPDIGKMSNMELLRKYPKRYNIASSENRMKGGKIQASNRSDFSDAKTFFIYDSNPFPDLVTIDNSNAYRYWRYLSPEESYGNIAEVEFYIQGSENITKGIVIGTEGSINDNPAFERDAAFDEDPLTFFDSKYPDNSWVGIDFSLPVVIDRVRCIPRNDDNYIRIGDTYELFYWGNSQWNSLGRRIANEKVLYYDVPHNALLWLRNLTRGREERIFTFENGKQRWW